MKKILLTLVIFVGLIQMAKAQTDFNCEQTGMIVNVGSQEYLVSLYHGGPVYTLPFESNVVVWEITDNQGDIITQDTVVDDPHYLFNHNIPITDTINVSAYFTNAFANDINGNSINCLIEDQLYWKIDTYPNGISYGFWTFVHENLGMDQNNTTAIDEFQIDESKLKIYPSPAYNNVYLEGPKGNYSLQIFDIQGQLFHELNNINGHQNIDVSFLHSGLYLINVNHTKGNQTIRFIKQ